jgi:hypothetical protein
MRHAQTEKISVVRFVGKVSRIREIFLDRFGDRVIVGPMRTPTLLAVAAVTLCCAATAPAETKWEKSAAVKRDLTKDVAWTSHEPLIFLLRRGTHAENQDEIYERQHDPENIKRMADAGVRYGRIHFYKGFGLQAEMDDIRKTQKTAELMHRYGMKVSLYVAGTMFIETFYRERPEARGWEQRDQENRPVPYMQTQTYRHYPCPNEPAYRAYVKQVLKLALETIHPDQIFFDNIMLQPEPKSCRCPRCLAAFHAYLKQRYPTPEAAKRRFGYPDTDWLIPTEWDVYNRPDDVVSIDDPVLQEWIGFRCESLAKANNDYYDYIKSVNPAVSVGFNLKGLYGYNRMWLNGVYHPLFSGHCDFTPFDVTDMKARIDSTGALIGEIRSFKLARRLGINCEDDAHDELGGAINMAFDYQKPVPGYGWQGGPWGRGASNVFTAQTEFFREYYERYYTETDNVADVAVLRTWASMAYSVAATQAAPLQMEQVLIQDKIPFDILYEEQIDRLHRYRAVILAGQECVSAAQADRLLQYAQAGGTVVFTGNTASYNQWREVRGHNPLLSLIEPQPAAPAYTQALGRGKLVYIPQILPHGTPPARFSMSLPKSANTFASLQQVQAGRPGVQPNQDNPEIIAEAKRQTQRFSPSEWILPANHAQIRDVIVDALAGGVSIRTDAPLTTVLELLTREKSHETLVHFVNFDRTHPLAPFAVDVRKQYPGKVKSVLRLAPDRDDPVAVPFQESGERLHFTVPAMGVYSLIAIAYE